MNSSTTDTSKLASAGAATATGLDLLFAASQLTSPSSSGGGHTHHRQPEPVNHGQYLYAQPPQRGMIGATSNHADMAAPSRSSDAGGGYMYSQAVEPNTSKTFVQVLMDILNDWRNESIICWTPDGQSFLIADQKRFEREILPQVFRGSLFNSFVRKLNRWGFRRLKKTGHASHFAHDLFLRDKPWLCAQMRCTSKPSYKKVPLDVRQSAPLDAGASVTISPSDDVVVNNDVPTSNNSLYCNMNNVSQPLTSRPFDVTNIPLSSTSSLLAAETDMEESLRRELLYRSIMQQQQQQQQRSLQMDQMQYLNNMSALTDDELLLQRYLQSSSLPQYVRDMMCGNCTEQS